MGKNNDFIMQEDLYIARNYDPFPVVFERGRGVWLWDVEGKKYLDMMAAYSAVSHGHCHPRLLKVLHEQSNKLTIVSRVVHNNILGSFLHKLCEITGFDKALPMNTGVEAVETAIKAARRWGYLKKGIPDNQAEIIVAERNFHGRTTTVVGFSTSSSYKQGFGPFSGGFKVIPFGDSESLAQAITPNTCAFLVEPVQGEGGIFVPPQGWLKRVRDICSRNKVLLILDEVQSGLGRTGKWFAFQHENIKPDGLIVGKALGGGLVPVSAFVANKDLMNVFTPGSHGSTFAGNPLAAAVGLEALKILEEEKLIERSETLGRYLFTQLKNITKGRR